MRIRSQFPEVIWPALPAQGSALLLATLQQLNDTQWWSAERLRQQQFVQIGGLLAHAIDTVPHYQQTLADFRAALAAGTLEESWQQIPLLTRFDVQRVGAALLSNRLPAAHGKTSEIKTSGSTGSPVRVLSTGITQHFWRAFTLREHLWHRRDLSGKLAGIRRVPAGAALPPDGQACKGWGRAVESVFETGPAALLSLVSSPAEQAAWLLREQPDYLLTFPTLLKALLEHCRAHEMRPAGLREVRTIGEVVTPELRALCRRVWDVPLVDLYSNQEAGYLALQCPEHEHYHVQAENVLLEILDEDNRPCPAGVSGRVVITALHNFATPLIRYETGDYAEAGAPCPCGRGLPVIRRIMGRSRNMLVYPDGTRRFPLLGGEHYADYAPVKQYQVAQTRIDALEVRLVASRPPDAHEENALRRFIATKMGAQFRIELVYCDSIPRTAGGKFEDFISLVSTPDNNTPT